MRSWWTAGLALVLWACAGQGRSHWQKVEPAINATCVHCHDPTKIDALIADLTALDNSQFSDANFPDSFFPGEVQIKTVDQLIHSGVPGDENIPPDAARQKAWILHEFNDLRKFMHDDPPPDYRTASSFDSFMVSGNPGQWQACNLAEKLTLGQHGDALGMPPLWAPEFFTLRSETWAPISDDDRQQLRDYVEGLLPGGLTTCE